MRTVAPVFESHQDYLKALIALLQLAYSGEKSAAYAYQGHWRSLKDPAQQEAIKQIEIDEWHHRKGVGEMLLQLNARPLWWRETLMTIVGRTVAVGCFLIGWFWPMYLAGKLETDNVDEYDVAAGYASALGLHEMAKELQQFRSVEKEHEQFFATMVADHPWLPIAERLVGWRPTALSISP